MGSNEILHASLSWPRVRIGDVAEIFDGPHATPAKTLSGPVFLGISTLNRGRLDLTNIEHLSEEEFVKWTRRITPKVGDVVFSYETRIGEAAIIPPGLRCCLGRRMGLVRVEPSRLDPHFFLYQYLSPAFQDFLSSRTIHGSTVDRIALKEFPDFEIDLPPLVVQRQVAKVMLDTDAKIDLNRRINQTLEQMAQAIFKSWFVDFDPVKAKIAAKQEGRDPLRAAMNAISGKTDTELDQLPSEQYQQLAATAALFPDEMVDSKLGEIPRGWEIKKFGDFIDRTSVGKKFDQKTAFAEGAVPILDQGKSGIIGFHNEAPGVYASLEKPVVVFANHTCYMRLITFDFSAIQNVLPFIGKDVDTIWAYYATKGKVKFSEYKGHWPDFVLSEAAVPKSNLTHYFRKFVQPLVSQMRMLELESEQLATLRDTLLPKLLSGELDASKLGQYIR